MIVLTESNVEADKICVYQSGEYRVMVSVQWWVTCSKEEQQQVIDNCRKAEAYDRDSPFSLPEQVG